MNPIEKNLEQIRDEVEEVKGVAKSLQREVEKQHELLFGTQENPYGIVTRMAILESQVRDVGNKLDNLTVKIDEINQCISKSKTKTMLYILTAISIFDGLISILIAFFH